MDRVPIQVERLVLGPIQANGYVALREDGRTAAVIDPGAEPESVIAALDECGAEPEAILLTHAHLDHVGGVAGVRRRWDVPIYLHPADRDLYDAALQQAAAFGLEIEEPPPPDRELEDGQVLELAGLELEVRHAPGHSPGGVVFCTPGHAFVGDCVFAGSVGRVDLPGGDAGTLLASIRGKILSLPDETVLWPGHGPETTVGREAETNPFLTGAFGWSG
ncbi:MAG TPA: MBL fold metallo-hydrolase [Gemmatimonadota bacterium]|nr:MBL fold metallo-hydrolase [Gemmatimonadota bacterium]